MMFVFVRFYNLHKIAKMFSFVCQLYVVLVQKLLVVY